MDSEKMKKFFNQWKPLSGERETAPDCLSESVLVALGKSGSAAAANEHLANCQECKAIVELLQETAKSPGANLRKFLTMTRARAQEVAPDRSSSILGYIWAFFSLSSARQAAAWAAVLAIMLTFGWGLWERYMPRQGQQISANFSLSEDKYSPTVQFLEASLDELRTQAVPQAKRQKTVEEINSMLDELNKTGLDKQHADQLQSLITEYQIQLYDASRNRSGQHPRTEKTVELLATYAQHDRNLSGRSGIRSAQYEVSTFVVSPEAIDSASREIQVVDAGKGGTAASLLVEDLVPNRNDESRGWVYNALQDYSNRSHTVVQFKSGSIVRNFSPLKPAQEGFPH